MNNNSQGTDDPETIMCLLVLAAVAVQLVTATVFLIGPKQCWVPKRN